MDKFNLFMFENLLKLIPIKLWNSSNIINSSEKIEIYKNLLKDSKDNNLNPYCNFIELQLMEYLIGKAYQKDQFSILIELIKDPNNDISIKTIKRSRKYLRFNKKNKPYINFTKADLIQNNTIFYTFIIISSISLLLICYLIFTSSQNLTHEILILFPMLLSLILLYSISDFFVARFLEKELLKIT